MNNQQEHKKSDWKRTAGYFNGYNLHIASRIKIDMNLLTKKVSGPSRRRTTDVTHCTMQRTLVIIAELSPDNPPQGQKNLSIKPKIHRWSTTDQWSIYVSHQNHPRYDPLQWTTQTRMILKNRPNRLHPTPFTTKLSLLKRKRSRWNEITKKRRTIRNLFQLQQPKKKSRKKPKLRD